MVAELGGHTALGHLGGDPERLARVRLPGEGQASQPRAGAEQSQNPRRTGRPGWYRHGEHFQAAGVHQKRRQTFQSGAVGSLLQRRVLPYHKPREGGWCATICLPNGTIPRVLALDFALALAISAGARGAALHQHAVEDGKVGRDRQRHE